ncbi:MAG: hydrogenase maturation protease [Verrucomicrobiota bacterium]
MNTVVPPGIEAELLVVGYGNSLRRDDGVGPRVAEAVEALQLPGVRTLTCQLLTPEYADPIARVRRVIFVDAEIVPGLEFNVQRSGIPNPEPSTLNREPILWRKLEPGETSQLMAHSADPRTMLALARDVFGHAPESWWLTIPAIHLGFGTDYSPAAEVGFHAAVAKIKKLVAANFRKDTLPVVG